MFQHPTRASGWNHRQGDEVPHITSSLHDTTVSWTLNQLPASSCPNTLREDPPPLASLDIAPSDFYTCARRAEGLLSLLVVCSLARNVNKSQLVHHYRDAISCQQPGWASYPHWNCIFFCLSWDWASSTLLLLGGSFSAVYSLVNARRFYSALRALIAKGL